MSVNGDAPRVRTQTTGTKSVEHASEIAGDAGVHAELEAVEAIEGDELPDLGDLEPNDDQGEVITGEAEPQEWLCGGGEELAGEELED